jgi:hypothetical protein
VFPAPSLRCQDTPSNLNLETQVFQYYSNESKQETGPTGWDTETANFMAAPYQSADQFLFDLSYRRRDIDDLAHISCVTLDSTYTAHVEYLDSLQTVTVNVEEGQPLNASLLNQSSLFYDVLQSKPTETGFAYTTGVHNFTTEKLFEVYRGTQLRAIRDTLVQALSGAISNFGEDNKLEDLMRCILTKNRRRGLLHN